MAPLLFIIGTVVIITIVLSGISLFWYVVVSKKRGVYVIETIVGIGGVVGIVLLIATGYSAELGDGIAALFGAFFLIPVVVGAIAAALFVKLTIVLFEK